jgi:hypothetical protein
MAGENNEDAYTFRARIRDKIFDGKDNILAIPHWIKRAFLGGKGFPPLSSLDYENTFRISSLDSENKQIRKAALKKAWELRDFEINKFWSRAAFFWTFIAAIFLAYYTLMRNDFKENVEKTHIDFYLLLLGVVFSVAWLLVIKGSKRWQETWEEQVKRLEKPFLGPLYELLYYRVKTSYSVSKITEILAEAVIAFWVLLLIQYLNKQCVFVVDFQCVKRIFRNVDWYITAPLIGMIVFVLILLGKDRSSSGNFRASTRLKRNKYGDKEGVFINTSAP